MPTTSPTARNIGGMKFRLPNGLVGVVNVQRTYGIVRDGMVLCHGDAGPCEWNTAKAAATIAEFEAFRPGSRWLEVVA